MLLCGVVRIGVVIVLGHDAQGFEADCWLCSKFAQAGWFCCFIHGVVASFIIKV